MTRFPLFIAPHLKKPLICPHPLHQQPVDYPTLIGHVEKPGMLDDEVPDEFKDVIAGTSDRISLEEAADDAR